MPAPDRPLTDEEKARLRDYQVAEILRRRNGDGHTQGAEAAGRAAPDAPDGPARPRTCPRCGIPYGKRVRCYRCKPPNPAGPGAGGDRTPRPARPRPAPVEVPAGLEDPSPPPFADALVALRAVCERLASLPDGDARWVLEAASLYRCRR
jgi:hypothetical protein